MEAERSLVNNTKNDYCSSVVSTMEHDGDGVGNYSISPKADPSLAERKLLDSGTSNVPPLEEYILFTKLGEIRFLFIATYFS